MFFLSHFLTYMLDSLHIYFFLQAARLSQVSFGCVVAKFRQLYFNANILSHNKVHDFLYVA